MNPESFSVKQDSDALVRLLAPKGQLFSALLSQVPDLGFFYEIPEANFPRISKKIIETGQFDLLLASVYEGRLVKAGESHVLRLSKSR